MMMYQELIHQITTNPLFESPPSIHNMRYAGAALLALLASAYLLKPSRNVLQKDLPLPSLRVNPSEYYTLDFYPGGHFLELPQGTMRYWLFGNPEGEKVLLIHGISTGSITYDKLARDLASDGFHVLVFDLWGRGYSDAPVGIYNESMYTNQVALLLQKVGWTSCHVIGVSLGGAIAASFVAFYPEIAKKAVFVCPAGLMESKDVPFYGKVFKLPIIRSIVLHPLFKRICIAGITRFYKSARNGKPDSAEALRISRAAQSQFMHHAGFFRAFLGTVIDYPLDGLHDRYKLIGDRDAKRECLFVWGDVDTTVPFRHAETALKLIPQARLSRYEGAAHDVLATHYKLANPEISRFLSL